MLKSRLISTRSRLSEPWILNITDEIADRRWDYIFIFI